MFLRFLSGYLKNPFCQHKSLHFILLVRSGNAQFSDAAVFPT